MPTPILRAALLAAATALACSGAFAAHRLNDTAIDFCIDGDGRFIDCTGTGQDAEFGRDVTRPKNGDGHLGFHFTKLCNSGERAGEGSCPAKPEPGDAPDEWGCTRDEVTGLLWENKTQKGHRAGSRTYTFYSPAYDPVGEYGGLHDATGFLNSVNEAGLCGAHDWRLPKPAELLGIVDMGSFSLPPVDERFFPNTAPTFYWGAGEALGDRFEKESAWASYYFFNLGDIMTRGREDPYAVRLVRSGEFGGKRYVISPDRQEVTDRLSGLIWRRCVEGSTLEGSALVGERCVGQPLTPDWLKTLAHARRQARNTGVAWRLPNLNELASLIDHEHLPHIDTQAFPGGGSHTLWSSSSTPADPTPRCVAFHNGNTFGCSQGGGGSFGSRLVRDR